MPGNGAVVLSPWVPWLASGAGSPNLDSGISGGISVTARAVMPRPLTIVYLVVPSKVANGSPPE